MKLKARLEEIIILTIATLLWPFFVPRFIYETIKDLRTKKK